MRNVSAEFYQTKYYVVESFYEKVVAENYTINQAIDRCLVEFWKQISDGGIIALAVYSTLFSRAAYHAPEILKLKHFQERIDDMNRLLTTQRYSDLSKNEIEELMDDVELIKQQAG